MADALRDAYEDVFLIREVPTASDRQAIEGLFPEHLTEHYHVLAHHYSHSGNTAKAVDYLHHGAGRWP